MKKLSSLGANMQISTGLPGSPMKASEVTMEGEYQITQCLKTPLTKCSSGTVRLCDKSYAPRVLHFSAFQLC